MQAAQLLNSRCVISLQALGPEQETDEIQSLSESCVVKEIDYKLRADSQGMEQSNKD